MSEERAVMGIGTTDCDPNDIAVRVEGVNDEEQLAAIRRMIAEIIDRRSAGALAATAADDLAWKSGGAATKATITEVGHTGTSLNKERQSELGTEVAVAVADMVGEAQAGCICYGWLPGVRIPAKLKDILWWDTTGAWVPPPGPGPAWIVALRMDPWCYARMRIANGATASPPVPKNQALIGLANLTSWAKEIWASNLCIGRVASVSQSGTNAIPVRMLLDMPSCNQGMDTIVFRKPGFLGIWHDVAHFAGEWFWAALGGTVTDFTWVFD